MGSWDGTGHLTTAAVPAEDVGQWVHLAGLYDPAAGEWRLYRNGQLVAATPDATGAVSVAEDWAIGARGTGTERFFQGTIDEARLYDRALTPDEIAVLAETATGPVTAFAYDDLGRQTKITQPDPDGAGPQVAPEIEYAFDAAGQLLSVTDPLDRVTSYEYDGLGRQIKQIDPDPDGDLLTGQAAAEHQTRYDLAGKVIERIDPLGHSTQHVYDNLGRLVSQIDALSGTVSYTYDLAGNRLSLTDPEENTTSWVYDDLNRQVEETNELGDTRYFAYDAAGKLLRRVDRLGRVRQFEFDNLSRNTAEIWYNSETDADADANRQNTLAFTYDLAGQMLSAGDASADYSYTYDALGRATSIDATITGLSPVVAFAQQFDAHGRRTQLAATIGGTADFSTGYAYDDLGRIASITQEGQPGGNAVAEKAFDFLFDAAGQPDEVKRYSDLAGTNLVENEKGVRTIFQCTK